ncbi:hypothetical protein J2810_000797 [Chryseobacterium rhizosphaerae]|uniref:glycine-rich domain-containing protein n=1 Tax=Chryseobacterium rhizosphaerae TaxID=395937 RepID=UPI00285D2D9C|nr:hypothetical protein [Chryseobacterium rhizosphaerae]MDR6544757.1 hypothetical protein [Chryseobacterium rhizosphaerae]
METKMVLQDEFLWSRIQGFSLDAPDADFPFSKKLAKEENWTVDFARKAIEEYKKFVYLCCILPNGASPSKIVDKVWHMHLIYTQNYWEEFCPDILKRNLHHHPSKGGTKEITKHRDWFSETLKSYKEIFQLDAPSDIWLQQGEKQNWRSWWKKLRFIPLLVMLSTLSSCLGEIVITLGSVILSIAIIFIISLIATTFQENKAKNGNDSGTGCGGSSCSGGSSCGGGGCGGGCGGCGGCGG